MCVHPAVIAGRLRREANDYRLHRTLVGYVPFSARKSGLTRRSKAGSGDPTANEEAAV